MSNIYRESRRMYFILFIHRKYVVGELELPSRTCICTYTVNYLRNQINKRTSVATTSTIRLHGDYGPKFSWRKSMTYKLQHKFVFIKFCLDKLKAHIPIPYKLPTISCTERNATCAANEILRIVVLLERVHAHNIKRRNAREGMKFINVGAIVMM